MEKTTQPQPKLKLARKTFKEILIFKDFVMMELNYGTHNLQICVIQNSDTLSTIINAIGACNFLFNVPNNCIFIFVCSYCIYICSLVCTIFAFDEGERILIQSYRVITRVFRVWLLPEKIEIFGLCFCHTLPRFHDSWANHMAQMRGALISYSMCYARNAFCLLHWNNARCERQVKF